MTCLISSQSFIWLSSLLNSLPASLNAICIRGVYLFAATGRRATRCSSLIRPSMPSFPLSTLDSEPADGKDRSTSVASEREPKACLVSPPEQVNYSRLNDSRCDVTGAESRNGKCRKGQSPDRTSRRQRLNSGVSSKYPWSCDSVLARSRIPCPVSTCAWNGWTSVRSGLPASLGVPPRLSILDNDESGSSAIHFVALRWHWSHG